MMIDVAGEGVEFLLVFNKLGVYVDVSGRDCFVLCSLIFGLCRLIPIRFSSSFSMFICYIVV